MYMDLPMQLKHYKIIYKPVVDPYISIPPAKGLLIICSPSSKLYEGNLSGERSTAYNRKILVVILSIQDYSLAADPFLPNGV